MYAAKIIGSAVCTCKEQKLVGLKLLVVQPISLLTLENEGKPVVAIDAGSRRLFWWSEEAPQGRRR